MVEASRIYPAFFEKKPRVILDRSFKFIDGLVLNEKGQLKVSLKIERLNAISGKRITTFKILKAEKVEKKSLRNG